MPEVQQIKVNNRVYKVAMNDQTRMFAMKLRRLYTQGYTDVDSFDEVSSEISSTLNNLLKFALSPEGTRRRHGWRRQAGTKHV